MNVDHHDLHHEFPEYAAAIHSLKVGSTHFARLFDEYHTLTAQIEALEDNDSPIADTALEEMKKQRIKLKDELYGMLKAAKA
ncbi:MAG: YdcH family protein [Rhodocyclales bacterium]|nr:YdcH family protein [Rhodocyclales bacterium]